MTFFFFVCVFFATLFSTWQPLGSSEDLGNLGGSSDRCFHQRKWQRYVLRCIRVTCGSRHASAANRADGAPGAVNAGADDSHQRTAMDGSIESMNMIWGWWVESEGKFKTLRNAIKLGVHGKPCSKPWFLSIYMPSYVGRSCSISFPSGHWTSVSILDIAKAYQSRV